VFMIWPHNVCLPEREAQPFHLVSHSPWPAAVGLASLNLAFGLVM
jgi:hypothetical protein